MHISYIAFAALFLVTPLATAPSAAAYSINEQTSPDVSSSFSQTRATTHWPVRDIDVSAEYLQKGPHWSGGVHTGLDFRAPVGTPIFSVKTGVVTKSGYGPSWAGIWIETSHANGLRLVYAHLSETNVKVGDVVESGVVIGRIGTTGNVTGPHLHLEALIKGRHVNPKKILVDAVKP